MFNLGVEAEQILFLVVVIMAVQSTHRLKLEIGRGMETIASYAIGGIVAFWLIDPVNGFF